VSTGRLLELIGELQDRIDRSDDPKALAIFFVGAAFGLALRAGVTAQELGERFGFDPTRRAPCPVCPTERGWRCADCGRVAP
jgi:hypothetical protein